MPKSTDTNLNPNIPGTNPSVDPKTGAVNPSAPTVGTEQWGNTSDERRTLGQSASEQQPDTSNKRDGRAPAGRRPEDTNQGDLSRRTSASAYSMNTSHGGADRTFRCADMGNADCRFETSGDTEDEVMRNVEEHWKRDHGLSDWTGPMRSRVRDNIRHREAA
jgi:predicted small metal-binding protein